MTRPRIAFFTPLAPVHSGIAQYSEELLPYLSETFDIDIYIDEYTPTDKWITNHLDIFHYLRFDSNLSRRKYHQIIYHMGNNLYHTYMYPFINRYPGILVLHDYVLHHSRAKAYLSKNGSEEYKKEMIIAYGEKGRFIANCVIRERSGREVFIDHLPFNERFIRNSGSVIVHNNYVREMLASKFKGKECAFIPMGIEIPESLKNPDQEKGKLGFNKDTIIISSLGHISSNKKFNLVFKALSSIFNNIPEFKFILIGSSLPGSNLKKLVPRKLLKNVIFTGYVTPALLETYLNATDLFINLREPYTREASAAMLRCMSYGKPVIISHLVHNYEIPENICYKVSFSPKELDEIKSKIIEFCENRETAERMGRLARKFVFENHSIKQSSKRYKEFIMTHLRKKQLRARNTYLSANTIDRLTSIPTSMLYGNEKGSSISNESIIHKEKEYLEDLFLDLGIIGDPDLFVKNLNK